MTENYRLAKMTWQETEARIRECDTVIVPVGSAEQHGPALPIDNDCFIATRFAELVCDNLWPDTKVTLAPSVAFGFSPHHMAFKGTITLSESTLANVIVDICMSLDHHGFTKILMINGHGGNQTAISNAIHMLANTPTAKVFAIDWWSTIMDKIPEIFTLPVFHACDMETSVAWALGQRVLEEKRVDEPGKSPYPGYVTPSMIAKPPQVQTHTSMKDFTDSGVVGYSTQATKEKGQKAVDLVVQRISDFAKSL
ncbi:MAG: creatininase family protein [Candidatus Thorarchaeota archaeon]|nr:creatininase family protein [Candidatus Thorarchaeota archaeon]